MELKILMIDDSPDDVFFFKKTLSGTGISASVTSLGDGISGLKSIREQAYDCVFLDYFLPGMDGMEILQRIREEKFTMPVIMMTGQRDEQLIVKLMQAGATDYLPKHALSADSLRISIENCQRIQRLQHEKQLAEEALRSSEARLEEAQHIAQIGNWEHNLVDNTFFLSFEAKKIIEDYSNHPFLSFSKRIHPDDFELLRETMRNLKNGYSCDVNIRYYSLYDKIKYLNIKGYVIKEKYHLNVQKMVGTVQDITELKNAIMATKKATAKSKATSIVLTIAIAIFLLSEAVLDPFIDSLTASLLISLSFKGSIAIALKPIEMILEKIMVHKVTVT